MFTGGYPLKPEAKAIQEQYDAADTALLGCFDWTMPRVMANPLPVEFIDEGDRILMKFEENDERRVIHLDDTPALAGWMTANPITIERPIVLRDDGAARVGRPPESVLELIDHG